MDKYKATAEKVLKGIHPDLIAKEALVRAQFSSQQAQIHMKLRHGSLSTTQLFRWGMLNKS